MPGTQDQPKTVSCVWLCRTSHTNFYIIPLYHHSLNSCHYPRQRKLRWTQVSMHNVTFTVQKKHGEIKGLT